MKNKTLFYDVLVAIIIIDVILFIVSAIVFTVEQFEKDILIYPFLILLFSGVLALIVLKIGMAYHSFKRKQYIWTVVIILLGTIFSIIFYFKTMRKEFKSEKVSHK